MSGSCHWDQSLNDQKDFGHSPCWQWQRSPGTWGWCTFCSSCMRHGTSLPSLEGLSAGRSQRAHVVFPDSSSTEQNRCGRVQGTAGKCLLASAASRFTYIKESHRRHFSRSSAGKEDLVCQQVEWSSIDSRGTLVAGPPPSSLSVHGNAVTFQTSPEHKEA